MLTDKQREYNRLWRQKNRVHRAEWQRAWVAKNREKAREIWRKSKSKYPEKAKEQRLKAYGLTSTDYTRMVVEQSSGCAICQKKAKLHVDHNHDTGKVRGLLCFLCNTALGKFPTEEILLNAIGYLRRTM